MAGVATASGNLDNVKAGLCPVFHIDYKIE
jgi:hypothetical protein